MAMHQGFDLSRFKKVSSDDKSTTMLHANGNEVRIVHSALSPTMRQQIEALPIHMAKGGKVPRKMYADPEAPVSANDEAPTTEMDESSPAETDDESTPAQPAGVPAIPPKPDNLSVPDANTIDVIGTRPPPTAQQLDADDAAWEHDLTNIVLPRSVTQSADPQRIAADFVAKILAKRRAS